MTVQQEPGNVIAGYRIESMIGRGGMAVVYRAEDMRLGRKVALKLLTPQLADSEQFRQRFIRESRVAASLDHPNIVPIYEAGEADGQLFIAMRYVIGKDLKGVLAEEGGQLPVARALRLFVQIGDALDSAHQAGLVHRDVKPGNVLVSGTPDQPRHAHGDHVYLTDFGLTKRSSELTGGLTGTGHFLGTVDYVSPEQIQGKSVAAGTDIYAFGCMLYECLTGQLPFRRDDDAALLWAHLVEAPPPVTGVRPEVPGAVDAVVARAMAKDPADRYESCEQLLHELEMALGVAAPVSSTGSHRPGDSGGVTHSEDAPTGSGAELGTVTGDVIGGGEHPSFPSGPFEGLPASADAWHRTALPPPHRPGPEKEPPSYRYDDHVDPEHGRQWDPDPQWDPARAGDQDQRRPWEQGEQWDRDQQPDGGQWDGRQWLEAGPAAPARKHRWRLIALVAAAVAVLLAVAAVFLQPVLFSEDYRSYTSTQTLVPFRLEHPAEWGSAVGPASDIVLAPDPTAGDDLFFLKGSPEAWASMADIVRSGSSESVWLYVYTSAATFDDSWSEALQGSIAPLLPATTEFDSSAREVSVAGGPAHEIEAVTYDLDNPQTRLRVLVDVVQPPGAGGAVLLAFFAPEDTFEDHRPTFERVRDSLQITR